MTGPDPRAPRPASHDAVSPWLSVREILTGVTSGQIGALEIVEATLTRIDALDPTLHAYASVWPERARARAKALDALPNARHGPLHGVPIAVKDLCDVQGEPTKAGTVVLGRSPAERDATVVARLEAAGAVLLGKVKMTEGAYTCHHPTVEPPVNPWNASRWTGISSSGSGVAVAAGLCTAALGTDTGGSIRLPSSACGVVGLKATHGRVPLSGVYPLASSLDHIGPMARSVGDVARLFAVLAGADPRDPASLVAPSPEPLVEGTAKGLRVGFDPDYGEDGVDPEIRAAVSSVLGELESAGAELQRVEMPAIEPVLAAWIPICGAEVANAHAATFPSQRDEYGEDLARLIDAGLALTGRAVAEAWQHRVAYTRRATAVFDSCDLLVCPGIGAKLAANVNLAGLDAPAEAATVMRFTLPFNLTGMPSLTLPCGLDSEHAPIGVQLVGPLLSEERLLEAGQALETRGRCRVQHPAVALGA